LGSGTEAGQYFWNGGGGQSEEEENSGENAGDFARLASVDEAVAEDGDGGDAQDCAMDRTDAAKDAGTAKNDSGNGVKFVAGASVGLGLSEPGSVNDGSDGDNETCKRVGQGSSALDGNACVAGAFGRETNGAKGTAESGSMDEKPNGDEHEKENWRLSGNAKETFLAEETKPSGESKKRIYAMSNCLGKAAKE